MAPQVDLPPKHLPAGAERSVRAEVAARSNLQSNYTATLTVLIVGLAPILPAFSPLDATQVML